MVLRYFIEEILHVYTSSCSVTLFVIERFYLWKFYLFIYLFIDFCVLLNIQKPLK